MNLNEMTQNKIDQQEKILNTVKTESRAFSEEEKSSFGKLQKEIDSLKAQANAEEQLKANQAYMNEVPRVVNPKDFETQGDVLDDGGFSNIVELMNSIKNGDKRGRLQNLSTSDVGTLIPPKFSQDILSLEGEDEIVMPRANNIPAGSPPDGPFTLPYFQQGDDGATGGITMTWTAEGQPKPSVGDPVLKDLTLQPTEISGIATINNKTLVNWEASGVFVQKLMRSALASARDMKFLTGTGAGVPLGILNAPGAIEIQRDTAATVNYIDLVTMISRLYAGPGQPYWVINQTIMPTLMTLTDPNGNYIFNAGDATRGVPATLVGLPIIWNGKTPTLGNRADISLLKFGYYLTKMGSGPFIDLSSHSRFANNQTQFRLIMNMDGQPWVKDPLLLDDGETRVSPYVLLGQ